MLAGNRRFAGAMLALVLAACAEPPPPAPAPPPPPPPPPPPAPKCERLEEGCAVEAETRLPVPGTELAFSPPEGWVYAEREDASAAQKSAEGAIVVVTSFPKPEEEEKAAAERAELVGKLSERHGLAPDEPIEIEVPPEHLEKKLMRKGKFKRGKLGDYEMMLWELAGSGRRGVEGGILVFTAPVGEKTVLGVAYAPADDTDGTSAILKSLDTFSGGADEAEKTDEKADDEAAGDAEEKGGDGSK